MNIIFNKENINMQKIDALASSLFVLKLISCLNKI
jgi:hypothetical protein